MEARFKDLVTKARCPRGFQVHIQRQYQYVGETFAVQNCTACAQKTLHMRICKPTLTFRHVQQNAYAVHMQY